MGFMGRMLCRLGLHDWSRPRVHIDFSSHVKDCEAHCRRCGEVKHWVEPAKNR